MERIQTISDASARVDPMEVGTNFVKRKKKKLIKGIVNYGGIAVGSFLMVVAGVVMTTDIRVDAHIDFAAIGLSFFVLMFCSYAMYVSCVDSGIKRGINSDIYQEFVKKYEEKKQSIFAAGLHSYMSEFCEDFVARELISTRKFILAEVGIPYEEYENNLVGKDPPSSMSRPQKNAVRRANKVRPIKLRPDMLITRGRSNLGRSPLGADPHKIRYANYVSRFAKIFATSSALVLVVLDVRADINWAVIAAVLMKLMMILLQGFYGYSFGFENITEHTVNYMSDQMDMLEHLEDYCRRNGKTKEEKAV